MSCGNTRGVVSWEVTAQGTILRNPSPASLLVMLLAFVSALPLAGQAPARLSAGWDYVPVGRSVDILEDPGGTLSLKEVQSAGADRWTHSQSDVPNFAFDRSVFWLRLQIENPPGNERVLFEVAQPLVDYLDVYVVAAQQTVATFRTGDRRPLNTRAIPHRHFLFPLDLHAGESIQIYTRVASEDGLHDPVPLSLWQPATFALHDFYNTVPMAGMIFVYAALAAYHLIMFFSLRDRAYLLYSGCLIFSSLSLAIYWGFLPLVALGNAPNLANSLFAPATLLTDTFLVFYARSFLDTRRTAPRWDRVLAWFTLIVWICAIPALLVDSYMLANLLCVMERLSGFLLLILVAFVVYARGERAARFFLYAFGSLCAGVLIRMMHMIGVMNLDLLSNVALYLGLSMNAILLGLGLADRINILREEKEKATRESAENLARQNEQLRALDRLKDEFLANTSHELRTPLHGIIGITESILEASSPSVTEETAHNLRLVARSGRRLSRLVDDILDFAKLTHGDLELNRRPLQLRSLVDVVMELSRPLASGKPLQLLTDVDPDLPLMYADEDRLQQILYNLVGNAIKFTHEGTITVSGRPLIESGGSRAVEVTVADTGIGIPPIRQEAIFESFSQADGSIAREYGGTGLGLAVTKNLVELHGGRIRVDSAVGEGTRLIFTIPTVSSADAHTHHQPAPMRSRPAPEQEPDMAHVQTIEAKSVGSRQALIVDDDPVNLQVLRNHLALEQIQTTSAQSGREALRLLGEHVFDLVLLDVMMPGLTGYDVCRTIRERHSHSELPVIMLTAKNRLHDLEEALEHGANDYLSKPFEARELRARVRTMLALRDAARTQSEFSALQSEIELARRIQQSLIPEEAPVVAGLQVAAHYRAMQRVGGDFYDFRAGHNRLAILMADVSGHGVPAALIVSMVHLAFWFQKENLESPDLIFGRMNEILYGNIGDEFVTACYLHFDTVAGSLVVGNAGHPPLMIWRKRAQKLLKLRPRGRILGLLPDPRFETERLELEVGDRILIYTDGALEAPSADQEIFGEERLAAALRDNQDRDPGQFIEDLIQTLLDWSGGPDKIDDDIALVAADFLGVGSPES